MIEDFPEPQPAVGVQKLTPRAFSSRPREQVVVEDELRRIAQRGLDERAAAHLADLFDDLHSELERTPLDHDQSYPQHNLELLFRGHRTEQCLGPRADLI
jgi:hypothetical protein